MHYIKRDMESTFLRVASQFKVVLVTGPRQVGKTTMMKKLMEGSDRRYVTLDDMVLRDLAKNDPATFINTYSPPVFIDEVQYAPELFSYIKMQVDERQLEGDYWLSGSQVFRLMRGVSESLAGRVGLLDLFPLSQNEVYNHKKCEPLKIDFNHLKERANSIPDATPVDIYTRIFNGGMPEIIANDTDNRDRFYESYIRTYIERDVRDLSGDINVLKFHRFMIAVTARTAQLVNYKAIADDAEIDQVTAKSWLDILETLGLIFYLHPYSNNLLKRTIKSPKLYFYDSGLVAFLAKWNSIETLMNGAQAGAILENFVVSEIVKGYCNCGQQPFLHYYRDKDNKEIDVLWEANGTLYPLEIKKTSSPDKRLTHVFKALDKSDKILGNGGVVCLYDNFLPFDKTNFIIPIRCV
ncbi:MAG: ATP-binding protein [Oscillospiraceae bacterium]|jgi:predicted AAA+ superfamily ATPase|nr:ATP-binding protein [Oscillospiraceae bacterium]